MPILSRDIIVGKHPDARELSMPLSALTARQREIVHCCLRTAADRPELFPDWEFRTIFGLSRPQMAEIAARWPDLDETDETVRCAINNAMNNLLGYPHIWQREWSAHFDFTQRELDAAFAAWRGALGHRSYFDDME